MPVVVRGVTQAGNGSTTSVSSLAVSSPGGTLAGDLLLLCAGWQTSTVTITTPTGWTQLSAGVQGNGNSRVALYGRMADGTGTDSPTVALSGVAQLILAMAGFGG